MFFNFGSPAIFRMKSQSTGMNFEYHANTKELYLVEGNIGHLLSKDLPSIAIAQAAVRIFVVGYRRGKADVADCNQTS